jgi:drug/metabolite transporter (DMT)-like permease
MFAIFLGKDHLNLMHLIAAVLIFLGVWLVTSGKMASSTRV